MACSQPERQSTKYDCSVAVWQVIELICTNIFLSPLHFTKCHFVKSPQQIHCQWRRRPCTPPLRRICSHSHRTPRRWTAHRLLSGRQSTRRGREPCRFLRPLVARSGPSPFPFEFQVPGWPVVQSLLWLCHHSHPSPRCFLQDCCCLKKTGIWLRSHLLCGVCLCFSHWH